MNCCQCTHTLAYCPQDICANEIDLDVLAQVTGVHTLVLDFLGIQIKIQAYIEAGDSIIFPLSILNEGYEYTGNIYDPDGAKVIIRKDSTDYDCFKFRTLIALYSVAAIPEGGL